MFGVAYRVEVTRLDGPKRTPQGGIRAEAAVTRSGVLEYHRPDGTVSREYRPPEEVFKADSMASLVGAPVTRLHPGELVTAKNFAQYSRGHVGETVKQEGDKLTATVFVQDADLVAAIESGGLREVSCGYACRIDETSGVTDTGERYDRIQRDISYNHLAVVPVGRAGSEIALRLDANDNAITTTEPTMKFERIDSVDYEIGSDAHKAAVVRRDDTVKTAREAQSKLEARADAAEADVAKLKAELAEMPAKLAAQVQARSQLIAQAGKVLGEEVKLDAMDDLAIRTAIAAKGFPSIRLDGKDATYISALCDAALTSDELVGAAEVQAVGAVRVDSGDMVEAARLRMLERQKNSWKGAK